MWDFPNAPAVDQVVDFTEGPTSYTCIDATAGAAVWKKKTGAAATTPPTPLQYIFNIGLTLQGDGVTVDLDKATDALLGGLTEPPPDGLSYARKNDAGTITWVRALTPVPFVNNVVPSNIGFKDPATTMVVTGDYFTAQSIILWDLADRPTTFVSATQLTTPLDPAAFNNVTTDIYVSVRTGTDKSAPPPKKTHVEVNPYITAVAPTSAPAGTPVLLTVTGNMFQTDVGMETKITIDGVPIAATTLVNASTLTATYTPTAGARQVNVCGGSPMTVRPDPAYPAVPFTGT